jgi:hypothetical protein
MITYNFGVELLDLCRLLIGPPVIEVTHGRDNWGSGDVRLLYGCAFLSVINLIT